LTMRGEPYLLSSTTLRPCRSARAPLRLEDPLLRSRCCVCECPGAGF